MRTSTTVVLAALAIFMGLLATSPATAQSTAPAGKLVLFADLAWFAPAPEHEACTVKNRFKKGENVGFRLYAVDGGTNKPEESAKIMVHLSFGGKTYDLPALFRGIPQKNDRGNTMPVHAGMWTVKWKVPDDAPTGTVHYSATASDKYGRTADWMPQGGEESFLTIVP